MRQPKERSVPADFSAGWLEALDSRTALARDMRGRFAEVCTDLGGAESLSYLQRSLIERALWLEYWIAQQERHLAEGGGRFDSGPWIQAANALMGLYSRLGLRRAARPSGNLSEYVTRRPRNG